MRRVNGFTLLEVLVALFVVAFALTALVRVAGISSSDFAGLRDRTLAGWIAANVLAETRLATAAPPIGQREGQMRFAGRDWRWGMDVQNTPEPGIRRLDIRVYRGGDRDDVLATLTGFRGDVLRP